MADSMRGGKFSVRDEEFNAERLREITAQMVEAISSPPFVEAMRAVRAAPEDQRLVEGSRRLTPDALREQGVPLPPDMRISSRYFEAGFTDPIELGELPGGRPNVVNALNEYEPGLLDRLRKERPEVFDEITKSDTGFDLDPRGRITTAGIGGCACGGGLTFCGGAGGSS